MPNKIEATLHQTTGPIFVERNGERIELNVGDGIYESDVIITGNNTTADILYRDGTKSRLAPDTELRLVDFEFGAGDDAPSFVAELAQGAMRTVTGEIVKLNPESFEVITPRGTAGIRGTEFTISISLDGGVMFTTLHITQTMVVTGADGNQSILSAPLQLVVVDAAGNTVATQQLSYEAMTEVLKAIAPSIATSIPTNAQEQGEWWNQQIEGDASEAQEAAEEAEAEAEVAAEEAAEAEAAASEAAAVAEAAEAAAVVAATEAAAEAAQNVIIVNTTLVDADIIGIIAEQVANDILNSTGGSGTGSSVLDAPVADITVADTGTGQDIENALNRPIDDVVVEEETAPSIQAEIFDQGFGSDEASKLNSKPSAGNRTILVKGDVEAELAANAYMINNPASSSETSGSTHASTSTELSTSATAGNIIGISGDVGASSGISGDAMSVYVAENYSLTLGDDTIVIGGNGSTETQFTKSNVEGNVYGDANAVTNNGTVEFGGDTIGITGDLQADIYGDAKELSGDGTFIFNKDTINIVGDIGASGNIYGDTYSISTASEHIFTLGEDTINIMGNIERTAKSTVAGSVYGDAYTVTNSGRITFSKDTINIIGDLQDGGNIYGDAHTVQTSGIAKFGDDVINIAGNEAKTVLSSVGADIYGDANTVTNAGNLTFGNDQINIHGTLSKDIYGDAKTFTHSSTVTYGNDTINVFAVNNGNIYGDTPTLDVANGGNDTITIGTIKAEDVAVNINGNGGNNTYYITGSLSTDSSSLDKESINFLGGNGTDDFTFGENADFDPKHGTIKIDGGNGTNTYNISGAVAATALNFSQDGQGNSDPNVLFQGGTGVDDFNFNTAITVEGGGKIEILGGDGDNTYDVAGRVSVTGKSSISIMGGAGKDDFNFGSLVVGKEAQHESQSSSAIIEGGGGENSYDFKSEVETKTMGDISIIGGAGKDTFTLNEGFFAISDTKIVIDNGDSDNISSGGDVVQDLIQIKLGYNSDGTTISTGGTLEIKNFEAAGTNFAGDNFAGDKLNLSGFDASKFSNSFDSGTGDVTLTHEAIKLKFMGFGYGMEQDSAYAALNAQISYTDWVV